MISKPHLISLGSFVAYAFPGGGMSVNYRYVSRDAVALHAVIDAAENEMEQPVGCVRLTGRPASPTWLVSSHADCVALSNFLLGTAEEGGPNCGPHRRAEVFHAWDACLPLIGPDAKARFDREALKAERLEAIARLKAANGKFPRRP